MQLVTCTFMCQFWQAFVQYHACTWERVAVPGCIFKVCRCMSYVVVLMMTHNMNINMLRLTNNMS